MRTTPKVPKVEVLGSPEAQPLLLLFVLPHYLWLPLSLGIVSVLARFAPAAKLLQKFAHR
jgi:hypothetical protein